MNATRGTSDLPSSIHIRKAAKAATEPAARMEAAPFHVNRSCRNSRSSVRSLAGLLFVVVCALVMVTAAAGADKKDKDQGRLLFGKVLDQQDSPVNGAIVYLTNTRTHAVKTYIVGAEGTYRFPGLSTTVDYEVYAQHNNHKSDTKSVSQFDDRSQVYIDLRIDTR